MVKRIVSIILSIILSLSFLTVSAFASEVINDIKINGQAIEIDAFGNVTNSAACGISGGAVKYSSDTHTITLEDTTITSSYNAITTEANYLLKVVLIGENKIIAGNCCIETKNDLSISGTGSLTLYGAGGLFSYQGNIYIKGSDVLYVGDNDGIKTNSGNIEIEDSTVSSFVTGIWWTGIYSGSGKIIITNSEVEAWGVYGIKAAEASVIINNSIVTAQGANYNETIFGGAIFSKESLSASNAVIYAATIMDFNTISEAELVSDSKKSAPDNSYMWVKLIPENSDAEVTSGGYIVEWSLSNKGTLHVYGNGIATSTDWPQCVDFVKKIVVDDITEIGINAFNSHTNATEVIIANTVVDIGEGAFGNCTKLGRNLFIPNSVNKIGAGAFLGCSGVKNVFFSGDAPIIKGTTEDKPSFDADVTIYYQEGTTGWTTPTWNGYNTAVWPYTIEYPAAEPTCNTPGNIQYWEHNGNYYSDLNLEHEINEDSWIVTNTDKHDYDTPIYEWDITEKNCTVKATAICNNDNAHRIEETVDAVKTVAIEPTCHSYGTAKYTASFTNAIFTAQEKETYIPMTDHNFSNVDGKCQNAGCTATDISKISEDKQDVAIDDLSADDLSNGILNFWKYIWKYVNDIYNLVKSDMIAYAQAISGQTAPDGQVFKDVKLKYKDEYGNEYVVGANNFPSSGIDVTITYEELGITKEYAKLLKFTIVHMFGEDKGSHKAGEMEHISSYSLTDKGITFNLTSCSPVYISWGDTLSSGVSDSHGDTDSIYLGSNKQDSSAEINPNTGASEISTPIYVFILLMLATPIIVKLTIEHLIRL